MPTAGNSPSIRTRNDGLTRSYPVTAAIHIYEGDLIMLDSAGNARPAASVASNKGCVGVAMQEADNSAGAAGAIRVQVKECEVLLADDGGETLAIANTLVPCYSNATAGAGATPNQSKQIHLVLAGNEPFVGMTVELDPTTSNMWVLVGPSVRRS